MGMRGIQKVKKNWETEDYALKKGTRKQNKTKTETRNMPDQKFKIMIIKLLTGLEKRIEAFSETFNKKKILKRTNQS